MFIYGVFSRGDQERPYHNDSTASRLLSEVKHCRAVLVLRWGTTLESTVLFFFGPTMSRSPLWAKFILHTFRYKYGIMIQKRAQIWHHDSKKGINFFPKICRSPWWGKFLNLSISLYFFCLPLYSTTVYMNQIKLNWIESSWIESNQIELDWIKLSWIKSNWIELNQVKSNSIQIHFIEFVQWNLFNLNQTK